MSPRKWFQFRLSTLMLFVALAAVATSVWLRLIAPNISGVSIQGDMLIFHMTDEYGPWMMRDNDLGQSRIVFSNNVLLYDFREMISLYFVVPAICVLLALCVMARSRLLYTRDCNGNSHRRERRPSLQ